MILQEQQLIPLVCDKCHRAEAGSMILIGEECGAIDIRVCIGRLKLDSSKEL